MNYLELIKQAKRAKRRGDKYFIFTASKPGRVNLRTRRIVLNNPMTSKFKFSIMRKYEKSCFLYDWNNSRNAAKGNTLSNYFAMMRAYDENVYIGVYTV